METQHGTRISQLVGSSWQVEWFSALATRYLRTLKIPMLGLHSRPIKSEYWRKGPALVLIRAPTWFYCATMVGGLGDPCDRLLRQEAQLQSRISQGRECRTLLHFKWWEFHHYHSAFPLLENESTSLSKAENPRGAKDHKSRNHSLCLIPGKREWSLLNPSLALFLPRMSHSSISPLLKYPFFHELFPNFKKRKAFSVSLTLQDYETTSVHFLLLRSIPVFTSGPNKAPKSPRHKDSWGLPPKSRSRVGSGIHITQNTAHFS